MRRALIAISGFILASTIMVGTALAAPSIDPKLRKQILAAPTKLTQVIITFNHKPTSIDFMQLKALGIKGGFYLNQLPMVLTSVNKAQFDALSRRSDVRSIYGNNKLKFFDDRSRPFIGVNALRADSATTTHNQGLPVTGGGVGIAYVDTGIDGTHPDLQLGKNLAGNVFFPLAEEGAVSLTNQNEFVPVIAVENAPNSDVEGGHGTFGAFGGGLLVFPDAAGGVDFQVGN